MATAKSKMPVIGSARWVQNEHDNAEQLIEQEVDEFGFSARNEFEWLNEHMADIFSKNEMNFADVFKTPGKLRGKTPRTARKVNALVPNRQPLSDIFAPSAHIAPPAQNATSFYDKVAHFQIAEDRDDEASKELRSKSRSKSPQRMGKPGNTDSGYHGMTEDEMDAMDADALTETATVTSSQGQKQNEQVQKVPLREHQPRPQPTRQGTGRMSDESFLSAREEVESRNVPQEPAEERSDEENATAPNEEMAVDEPQVGETPAQASGPESERNETEAESHDQEMEDEAPQSPSDTSSPEKPLQRKSSFNFSGLPAREPLAAKRSVGGRNSQIDIGRHSVLAVRATNATNDNDQPEPDEMEETAAQAKTVTQTLHEKIMMLGKTKESRTSKSIPQSVLGAQAVYPQLPAAEAGELPATETAEAVPMMNGDADLEDDDDDWIAPTKPTGQPAQSKHLMQDAQQQSTTPAGSPARYAFHQKSISTTQIPTPPRPVSSHGLQKSQSISNPSLANAAGVMASKTPAGTPAGRKHHDGPLSASKNKLWSALKSAKSIFASSASASAAAKLEAHSHHSPAPPRSPKRDAFEDQFRDAAQGVYNMPGALYSNLQFQQPPSSPARQKSAKSNSPSRKTRSSTESDKKKDKEAKAQRKAEEELEKAREKERAKATKQLEEQRKADELEARKQAEKEKQQAEQARPTTAESESQSANEMPSRPPPKSMLPAGKLRAPGRLARPGTREPPQAASRPAPVSIRVASQSQRVGQSVPQPSLSKSQHESMAPPPPPKTGLRTASAQGNVRASSAQPANNARVRALEAAARKKEADERAAAKKLEAKRELERKRAAKAEEERRADEERKAAERARVEEAKLERQRKAEHHAAEAKKREQARFAEQRRFEEERAREEERKAQAARDLAEAIKRERAVQAPMHARVDVGGTLRQLSKQTVQSNPLKPAKRVLQGEDEEHERSVGPAPPRPGLQRGPASYQQNDAKRRRTNEEDEIVERHSVMAPPKRPSNMRKESTLKAAFPHGYTHAPLPAVHHTSSMFKSTVTAQHQMQHGQVGKPMHPSQTVQMSNARIPFAENANPPQHPTAYQQQHGYYAASGVENAQPGNKFKTPARPAQAPKSARSSPVYPKGDNIELPDIQTDSEEEEDSEDEGTSGFRAPSWVASPALRELLTQQQLVDPETVFGPIGELKMEEVFKGGKNADRVKKFRDRGSSARWVESGDAVTSAEKRKDMEGRERLYKDGGWRYEPS